MERKKRSTKSEKKEIEREKWAIDDIYAPHTYKRTKSCEYMKVLFAYPQII